MKHTVEVMKFSNQSAQASKGISLGERLVFADVLNIVCRALHANGWYAGSELSQQYRNFLISPASPLCVAQVLSIFLGVRSLEPQLSKLPPLVKKTLTLFASTGIGVYLIQIPIINYLNVNYDQPCYAWLKDDAFIRGLFVFAVATIVMMAAQFVWKTLKRKFSHF